MSYLLNYKNWRALHESMALNEALQPGDLPYLPNIEAVQIGNKVKGLDAFVVATTSGGVWLNFDKKEHSAAMAIMNKVIGKEAIPSLRIGNVGASGENYVERVFGAIIAGIGQNAGSFDPIADVDTVAQLVPNLGLTLERGDQVQLYGKETGAIDTQGTTGGLTIATTQMVKASSITAICGYINAFNLTNWAAGDFTQYDPTKILNDNRIVDLTGSNPGAVRKESGYVILASPAKATVTGGDRGTTTELAQGEEAQTGAVAIAFTTGRADIDDKGTKVDANHPSVKEMGDKIISYLGDSGVADTMTLISSASPDYGTIKNAAGWEKSYPKGTTGTSDPGAGADDAGKNMKLAYDRGVTFRNALTAYLGGHLKANSIAVSWKISTAEPNGGKNVSYSITTKSEAPQPITKTTYQGAKVNVEMADNAIYVYKVKYNAASVAKNKPGNIFKGETVAYENLKVGQKVVILATDMKTQVGKDGDVVVTKIEDNKLYVKYKEGEEKMIPKDRYVKQVGKAEKAGPEI
jgi:RNase P/RNase MRP subunit p29